MPDDRVKRNIRIYYHYGYSYKEIADRTGALFSKIRKAIQEGRENEGMTQEIKESIAEMLREGSRTNGEIAAEFGISTGTVKTIRKELGDSIPARKAGRRKNPKNNEPTAEATAASPSENVEESVSEDIIPPSVENVKPIPEIILLALTDKLEDEMRRLTEADTAIEKLEAQKAAEIALRDETQEHIKSLRKYITDLGYHEVLTIYDKEEEY